VRLYQRLLARDLDEAAQLVSSCAQEGGGVECLDAVVLPALALLERDRARGLVDEEQIAYASETLEALAGGLNDVAAEGASEGEAGRALRTLCLPAREGGDEIASAALAEWLRAAGLEASASGRMLIGEMVERVAAEDAAAVCISALPPVGAIAVRHLVQRILARCPGVFVVVGAWADPAATALLRKRLGAEARVHVVASFGEVRERFLDLAQRGRVARAGS
jgi:hypothetical protein